MKKIVAAVLAMLLTVALMLAAMLAVVGATLTVARISNPALRAAAVAAELVLGVVLLVGTVYVATRLAVRIFGTTPPQSG